MVDYLAALRMGKLEHQPSRRKWLVLSLCANLALLFAFKYFNLFNEAARAVFQSMNTFYDVPAFGMLLPVGISFYTFQTMSYTIDVYRGKLPAERHLGMFALYVSFFPQLVAGPIERSTDLLPQFYKVKFYDRERVLDGLKIMLWGFFKKIVVADRLAVYVNAVYNNSGDFTGGPLILATYFFAFQVYCDFSGYSDIAIGAARVMGYQLTNNFNRPFLSTSISEFWKRWHITLSSWFKDYLYIPLGGNRVSQLRKYANLCIVFILCGLWHGANWTFMIWGAIQGIYLVFSSLTKQIREKLHRLMGLTKHPRLHQYLKVIVTFHLVLFSLVFFRASSLGSAINILGQFTNISWPTLVGDIAAGFYPKSPGRGLFDLVLAVGAVLVMEAVQLYQRNRGIQHYIDEKPRWVRWAAHYAIIIAIVVLGNFNHTEFFYFQF